MCPGKLFILGQNKFKVTSGVVSGFRDGDIQMDSTSEIQEVL